MKLQVYQAGQKQTKQYFLKLHDDGSMNQIEVIVVNEKGEHYANGALLWINKVSGELTKIGKVSTQFSFLLDKNGRLVDAN